VAAGAPQGPSFTALINRVSTVVNTEKVGKYPFRIFCTKKETTPTQSLSELMASLSVSRPILIFFAMCGHK
jgi:hypothetical protein